MKPTTRFWISMARMGVALLAYAFVIWSVGRHVTSWRSPDAAAYAVGYLFFLYTFFRMGAALAGYVSIRQGVKARIREMEKTSGRDHDDRKQS